MLVSRSENTGEFNMNYFTLKSFSGFNDRKCKRIIETEFQKKLRKIWLLKWATRFALE